MKADGRDDLFSLLLSLLLLGLPQKEEHNGACNVDYVSR